MILFDAVYINDSGGKVLLDYLITRIEDTGLLTVYLLDERIRNNHPEVKLNKVIYLKPSIFDRHRFYLKYIKQFSKVFCFGNIPPTTNPHIVTYTYFHQPLFLSAPTSYKLKVKLLLWLKSRTIKCIKENTNFWIVQTDYIKYQLLIKYAIHDDTKTFVIPFYPSIKNVSEKEYIRNLDSFVYVSGGSPHKNHYTLLNAFKLFYDKYMRGVLHLTIDNSNIKLYNDIINLNKEGYPIINHGLLARDNLLQYYKTCYYTIYPSLAESFGLGIIEAIEAGCDVIGADLPYMHAVCEPSIVFDPYSTESLFKAMERGVFQINIKTNLRVKDEVDKLLVLLNVD